MRKLFVSLLGLVLLSGCGSLGQQDADLNFIGEAFKKAIFVSVTLAPPKPELEPYFPQCSGDLDLLKKDIANELYKNKLFRSKDKGIDMDGCLFLVSTAVMFIPAEKPEYGCKHGIAQIAGEAGKKLICEQYGR